MLTAPEQRLGTSLKVFTVVFAVAAVGYLVGPFAGPLREYSRQLPFVSNSVVKIAFLSLLCLYAAGDLRGRLALVEIIIAAHLISVTAMLAVILFGGDTTRTVPIGSGVAAGTILWGAIALDAVITLIIVVLYFGARKEIRRHPPPTRPATAGSVSNGEKGLRAASLLFGVVFSVAALGYLLGPLLPGTRSFFIELPFVTNSVVKVGTLALVCFYVAADVRRNMALMGVVIAAHLISIASLGVFLWLGPDAPAEVAGITTSVRTVMWGALGADAVIAVILLAFYQAAWMSRFEPDFLWPMEYRGLIALAGVVLRGNDKPKLNPYEVACNVDKYVAPIRARRRWIYHAVLFAIELHPLFYLKPPLSELDEESRLEHLKTHFYRNVLRKVLPEGLRRMVQAMIRIGKQLCYVGYYNDPKTFESVGYNVFRQRDRYRALEASGRISEPGEHPLKVTPASSFKRDTVLEADICIIGSGAAGAILAYNLAARTKKKILVVERGQYVQPREFTENEVEMIGKLYADGVFQQTEDFGFTILQGSCVGGSTTVNNAVCFDPPRQVLKHWNDPAGCHAGLDEKALDASIKSVRAFLNVQSQIEKPGQIPFLNPSGGRFLAGIAALPPVKASNFDTGAVEANIEGCLGCGYCNIGCRYGKKLSMLDTALPRAQREFGDRVQIVSECEVRRLRMVSGRPARILEARAEGPNGRRITIRSDQFVLSAGSIASSYLLMQSGVGRDLPVGRRMSFNMGSPLIGEFRDPVNAHDGLQISHFGRPNPSRGFVLETWWNPPATQAVSMPGWFEDHFENMCKSSHLMGVGVLVGTTPTGYLREALTGGPGVVFTPEAEDLRKLADGLAQTGEIMFAAGATRVMPNTWGYDVITHPNQLNDLYRIASDPSYITLGTGHPQGGNAVSVDPRRGVVDPEFRVHGFGNLFVCDASVFPTSVTVNPQLTIMALAHYAAQKIG